MEGAPDAVGKKLGGTWARSFGCGLFCCWELRSEGVRSFLRVKGSHLPAQGLGADLRLLRKLCVLPVWPLTPVPSLCRPGSHVHGSLWQS